MGERPAERESIVAQTDGSPDLVYELKADRVDAFLGALHAGQEARVRGMIQPMHAADVADLLERLGPGDRETLLVALGDELDPDVLLEVDETVREAVLDTLNLHEVAAAVAEMESDDAVQVIEELDEADRQEVLQAIPRRDRLLIEEALAYPEDSAGRLMQREVVTVPAFWTVGQTIDYLRRSADEDDGALPQAFYDIFVVDPMHRPVGAIPLSRLLRNRRPVPVTDIMTTDMRVIPAAMDQEEVAFLFRQRDLVSAPVINDDSRLVGTITIDDVVDVIEEEHEEDIMRLGGVQEDDLYSAAMKTTRLRFVWLLVNLGTAVLASVVIGIFEDTLRQLVALAILMPIVASMGGNADTQTLTVAVRAIASKEINPTNAYRLIGKEVVVGTINGVLFAVITGAIAWYWFSRPEIGLVIGIAMIVNMVVGGLGGITIPIVLHRLGVDPAVASSVFLTTLTDVVGFFAFLGLAAWLIL